MKKAFISVGSNINPEANVRRALRLLAGQVSITGISAFYRNEAVGGMRQPPFINGMVEIATEAAPEALKCGVLRVIEAQLGRERTTDKYAPRTIDLDLVLYDAVQLWEPAVARLAYLAVPLAELAPELVVPEAHVSITRIAATLSDQPLEALPEFTALLRKEIELG